MSAIEKIIVEVCAHYNTVIINAAGEVMPNRWPADLKKYTLKELQTLVGGYIQIQTLPGIRKLIVMNEEGKLLGLPHNHLATQVWRHSHGLADWICGTALICDPCFLEDDEEEESAEAMPDV